MNKVTCPTQCGYALKYVSQDDHMVSVHGESARGKSHMREYSYIVECNSCGDDMNSDFWLCPNSIESIKSEGYHRNPYRLCADCHGRYVELFFTCLKLSAVVSDEFEQGIALKGFVL